jgi:uncharacterized Zn-binding protein involved in type VI secretion
MSASPEEMGTYYEKHPKPPEEPEPKGPKDGEQPSPEYLAALTDPAFEQMREQYNAAVDTFESVKAAFEEENPPPTPAPVSPPPAPAGGAGKPAARMGDSCSHGGKIVLGCMTVLIGKQPAARASDMHVCPMTTGVVPHVGGPVRPPVSTTVLIGFLPAARMGDQLVCVGPPDVIAQGEMTVFIG